MNSLLSQDLSFREGRRYLIHNIHAFAAKFPPQLPRYFIEGLTSPGETVLDPMVGSGVTIVEAWLHRRNALGVDLDPLTLLLSKVRTTEYDSTLVLQAGERVLDTAGSLVRAGDSAQRLLEQYEGTTREFIDYWFTPATQSELAALIHAIRGEPKEHIAQLLKLVFSSVIITKSGGVSLARDLAHSWPHRVEDKTPKSALDMFSYQLEKAVKAIKEIELIPKGEASVIPGDC